MKWAEFVDEMEKIEIQCVAMILTRQLSLMIFPGQLMS